MTPRGRSRQRGDHPTIDLTRSRGTTAAPRRPASTCGGHVGSEGNARWQHSDSGSGKTVTQPTSRTRPRSEPGHGSPAGCAATLAGSTGRGATGWPSPIVSSSRHVFAVTPRRGPSCGGGTAAWSRQSLVERDAPRTRVATCSSRWPWWPWRRSRPFATAHSWRRGWGAWPATSPWSSSGRGDTARTCGRRSPRLRAERRPRWSWIRSSPCSALPCFDSTLAVSACCAAWSSRNPPPPTGTWLTKKGCHPPRSVRSGADASTGSESTSKGCLVRAPRTTLMVGGTGERAR